jgi:hypothetical protein
MKIPLHAAVLCASLAVAAAGAPPARAAGSDLEQVVVTQVEGIVVVDVDGSVAELRLTTPMSAELGPALESRLRALRFLPVTIGGVPVRARTIFVVALAAKDKPGGGLTVNIDGIDFAAPKDTKTEHADGEHAPITGKLLMPPRIPTDLLRSGVPGGGVDVAVRFGNDGKVEDAVITRSYIAGRARGGPGPRKFMRQFEEAALAAARKWQASVPADGLARSDKDRTSTVLVNYTSGTLATMPYSQKGAWVPVMRTPKRPVPWLAADAAEADRIAVAGGWDSSPAYRLVAPIAGEPVM